MQLARIYAPPITLVLLCTALSAQYAGNAPIIYEAHIAPHIGTVGVTIEMPENPATGDFIGVGVVGAGSLGAPYTCTDTLLNTYSYTVLKATTGPAPATTYLCYVCSGSSGANTISVADGTPGTGWALHLFHGKNISCTPDGAAQTANFNGTNTTISTTHTTTVNGDIILWMAIEDMFYAVSPLNPAPPAEYGAFTAQGTNPMIALAGFTRTTALGSYTSTANVSYNGTATMNASMLSIAFKPAASIAITTTLLPDAAITDAYKACLSAVGGTAALTYSASGYPPGLSFNTSTGCLTGTPGSVGTFTVATQVTDGSITSPVVNLTLKVGNAFLIPSIVSSSAFAGDSEHSGNFTVQCGDVIVPLIHGFDTHGGQGWISPGDGASNNIAETLNGHKARRLEALPGTNNAPIAAYSIQTTSAGTDSILISSNTTGSPLASGYIVLRNVQPILDAGSMASFMPQAVTNPYTYSSSYTTPVPNELLFKATATANNGGALDGIAFGTLSGLISPFSSVAGTDTFAVADTTVAVIGTTNDTATITVNGGFPPKGDDSATLMFAVRPALASSNPCAASGQSRATSRIF